LFGFQAANKQTMPRTIQQVTSLGFCVQGNR
jgi:hypothetical protein